MPNTDTAIESTEQAAIKHLREKLWRRPGFLVRRLHQIHSTLCLEECNIEGITPVQYGILTVLNNRPGIEQRSISYELGIDRTTTADVLRRLEGKQLVKRQVNPNDKRSRQVYITPAGALLMAELDPRMKKAQKRLLEPLSSTEKEQFMRLLTKVVEGNNEHGRAILHTV